VIFIEGNGKLNSTNDIMSNNTGFDNGGVLLATSGAQYSIVNASMVGNYAHNDAVISAVRTSVEFPFVID